MRVSVILTTSVEPRLTIYFLADPDPGSQISTFRRNCLFCYYFSRPKSIETFSRSMVVKVKPTEHECACADFTSTTLVCSIFG